MTALWDEPRKVTPGSLLAQMVNPKWYPPRYSTRSACLIISTISLSTLPTFCLFVWFSFHFHTLANSFGIAVDVTCINEITRFLTSGLQDTKLEITFHSQWASPGKQHLVQRKKKFSWLFFILTVGKSRSKVKASCRRDENVCEKPRKARIRFRFPTFTRSLLYQLDQRAFIWWRSFVVLSCATHTDV